MITYAPNRLHNLRLAATARRGASMALHDRLINQLHPRFNQLRDHVRDLERNTKTVPASLAEMRRQLADVEAEIQAIQGEQDAVSRPAAQIAMLVRACEEWIQTHRARPRVSTEPGTAVYGSASEAAAELRSVDDARALLRQEQQTVETAPVALAEAEAQLRSLLRSRGGFDATALLSPKAAKINLEDLGIRFYSRSRGQAEPPIIEAPWLLSLVAPTLLESGLAQLREAAQGQDGLTQQERQRRLADVEQRLKALEIREERAIRALEAAGQEVLRRPEASPAIVLDAQEEPQANTDAASPTGALALDYR